MINEGRRKEDYMMNIRISVAAACKSNLRKSALMLYYPAVFHCSIKMFKLAVPKQASNRRDNKKIKNLCSETTWAFLDLTSTYIQLYTYSIDMVTITKPFLNPIKYQISFNALQELSWSSFVSI